MPSDLDMTTDGENKNDVIPGGKAKGRPDSDFPAEQLVKARKIEKEHTPDPRVRTEIGKDHLAETEGEPVQYYDKPDMKKELAKEAEQFGPPANATEGRPVVQAPNSMIPPPKRLMNMLGKSADGMIRSKKVRKLAQPSAIPPELKQMLASSAPSPMAPLAPLAPLKMASALLAPVFKQAAMPVSPSYHIPESEPTEPTIPDEAAPAGSPAPLRRKKVADLHSFPPIQKLTGDIATLTRGAPDVDSEQKSAAYNIGFRFGGGITKEAKPGDVDPSLLYGGMGAAGGGILGYLLSDKDKLRNAILGALSGGALAGGGHYMFTHAGGPAKAPPSADYSQPMQPSAVPSWVRLGLLPAAATGLTEAGVAGYKAKHPEITLKPRDVPLLGEKVMQNEIKARELDVPLMDRAKALGLENRGRLSGRLSSYPTSMQEEMKKLFRKEQPFAQRFAYPGGKLNTATRMGKTFGATAVAGQLLDWIMRASKSDAVIPSQLNQPGA